MSNKSEAYDYPTVRLLRSMFGDECVIAWTPRGVFDRIVVSVGFTDDLTPHMRRTDAHPSSTTLTLYGVTPNGSVDTYRLMRYAQYECEWNLTHDKPTNSPEETAEIITNLLEQARGYHRD